MKQIIIFLLVIILGFIAYDFYKDWNRFHAPNYEYQKPENIDLQYHDASVVWDYVNAIQDVNTYVKLQYTANDIDVRAPEEDDLETQNAIAEYANRLAKVKYYENLLVQSAAYKQDGIDNETIKEIEAGLTSRETQEQEREQQHLQELYDAEIATSKSVGSRGALIYEVQKILVNKGYEIPVDGVFATITSKALADFESNNNLYPDGKLDVLTFDALLK
ncbi:peptidoglycan-binding domain-containing protein [Nonlabens ponticola]|uniref:Peptidoglycan-binding protein n=1 Tax=Nonlabens ponticola TaxID=2496866 RepID=A0A3S9MWT6_9FLAO|nr:peptidoglycan-binding domain-containing protein [Nonlabens ponticola]AZQ43583.1 peptidoglycan-binding protein [Nonlabens ponticola]